MPVLPAIAETLDDETLVAKAGELGYPLMVKPVLGRDGKGMRRVKTPGELRRALPRVKGDAIFSFWDERVYVEKALTHARHIEVQIVGDTHGNYVHMWERDGSIQRRFQQVAEEAPSPFVTPELRTQLGEAAIAIARKAGYVGVGTVEFLLDENRNFYFLEMTCRIQGGHAVTEWITGEDLVRWQIRVAKGETLPLTQEQIPLWGHAFQCRINAEDPHRDFAPSAGLINYLRTPAGAMCGMTVASSMAGSSRLSTRPCSPSSAPGDPTGSWPSPGCTRPFRNIASAGCATTWPSTRPLPSTSPS